jgi:hypothetical protein
MDEFTKAYFQAALWTTDPNPEPGEWQEHDLYTIDNIQEANRAEHELECQLFQRENEELLAQAGTPEQNGHDFWLTRNWHGTGFWDRGYPEHVSKELTADAHAWGTAEVVLRRGEIELTDDGTLDTVLHCSQCGREFRGNYDPEPPGPNEGRTEEQDMEAYDAWIGDFIAEIEDEHECGGDD